MQCKTTTKKEATDVILRLLGIVLDLSHGIMIMSLPLPVCTLKNCSWLNSRGGTGTLIRIPKQARIVSFKRDYTFEMYEKEVPVFNSLFKAAI